LSGQTHFDAATLPIQAFFKGDTTCQCSYATDDTPGVDLDGTGQAAIDEEPPFGDPGLAGIIVVATKENIPLHRFDEGGGAGDLAIAHQGVVDLFGIHQV